MNRSALIAMAGVSLGLGLSSSASAVVLVPNDANVPLTANNFALGTLVATDTDNVVSINGIFSGTLVTQVYQNVGGTLDFVYQYTANASVNASAINRISFTGFALPTTTDVNFRTDLGGTVAPTSANRSAIFGNVIGFNFLAEPSGAGNIDPSEQSTAFFIRTNAVAFTTNTSRASFIDGDVAQVMTFAPVPVPEPTSLAILAIGGIGVFVRRRKKA